MRVHLAFSSSILYSTLVAKHDVPTRDEHGSGLQPVLAGLGLRQTAMGEEDRCLHVALLVAAFVEMLTKSVVSRATTATRAGCVQRGLGQNTPFSGRGSRNAAEDDP